MPQALSQNLLVFLHNVCCLEIYVCKIHPHPTVIKLALGRRQTKLVSGQIVSCVYSYVVQSILWSAILWISIETGMNEALHFYQSLLDAPTIRLCLETRLLLSKHLTIIDQWLEYYYVCVARFLSGDISETSIWSNAVASRISKVIVSVSRNSVKNKI